MKIYYPNSSGLLPEDEERLKELGVIFCGTVTNNTNSVVEILADAEIIFANYISLNKEVLKKLKKLKHIITPSVGYDWIDVQYANSVSITVSNCPTFCVDTVAEHSVALLLCLLRGIPDAYGNTRETLKNKTVGLLGYGKIAKQIEVFLSPYQVSFLHINTKSKPASILELFKKSDILISTLPSTVDTYNFVSREKLKYFKQGGYFINVGRGDTVDEEALGDALISGKVRGAALDVIKDEAGTNQQNSLLKLPQVLYTPHIAYLSADSLKNKGDELVYVLNSCIIGSPINTIGFNSK